MVPTNPSARIVPGRTANSVIGENGTLAVLDKTPSSSYRAWSHSAWLGSNWFSSAGAYPTGSSTMPHSPVSSPCSASAVATGVADASSHASAPLVGHTHSKPPSFLTGKDSAHERGDARAVFAAAASTDIGIAAALPSVSNAQPW